MAGHNKWSKIKRKKGVADQKKGKVLTKITHEIMVAVKEGGGGDPSLNPRLRLSLDKAKAANMPNANVDRAIKRATGEDKSAAELMQLAYEGYGPGGTAVYVDVLTDNKNRTVSEIRHAFSRSGGSLGENGCVAWMFNKKGIISIAKDLADEESLMEMALEAGADDVSSDDEFWELTTEPESLHEVQQALDGKIKIESAELQMVPQNTVSLVGKEAEQMLGLLDALDDLDDVLDVSSNCEFEEE